MANGNHSQQGVESIEVGGRLLAALARAGSAMMLRDLAAAAGMAPAKAHRYLVSLARLGLVEQRADSGHYDVGPFAVQLGLAGLARLDPLRIALAELDGLRDALGHTVALAVWGNHGPTIVRWLESNAPVSASLRTGAVMPLTRSATGRLFLAYLPEAAWTDTLKAELVANRRHGLEPTTAAQARELIEQTRRHGLGRVNGDLVAGISSLAAPVFDANGSLVLGVIALGYRASFDAAWAGPVAGALREFARSVSARLGADQAGVSAPNLPL